jgi:hypothetical protein
MLSLRFRSRVNINLKTASIDLLTLFTLSNRWEATGLVGFERFDRSAFWRRSYLIFKLDCSPFVPQTAVYFPEGGTQARGHPKEVRNPRKPYD